MENTFRSTEFTTNPFQRTLEVLRRDGWIKGSLHARDGTGHCIVGAMAEAGLLNGFEWEGWEAMLLDVVAEQYDRPRLPAIAYFNDDPKTTFMDVERVVEKAAVKWDERV